MYRNFFLLKTSSVFSRLFLIVVERKNNPSVPFFNYIFK